MSYAGHAGSGNLASSGPSSSSGSGTYSSWSWASLSIVFLLWAMFGLALLNSPGTLTSIWEWATSLPMAGMVVIWVVALPWMLGLAVLEAGWPEMAQWAALAGLVVVSLATFYPGRSR